MSWLDQYTRADSLPTTGDDIPTLTVTARRVPREALTEKLVKRGYSPAGAQGIVDNFYRESGGNPDAVGDNGTSFGLGQWHLSRKADLEAYAKAHGKSPDDLDTQLDFMDQELKAKYPRLHQQMVSADDPAAAEDAFKRIYERPASVLWANRANGKPTLEAPNYRFAPSALAEHEAAPDTSLVHMTPDDYLALTPPVSDTPSSQRRMASLVKSLDSGDEVQAVPTLDVEQGKDGATVTDQDGRHRAILAKDRGVDLIPVAVKGVSPGQAPTEIQGMTGKLMPFDFNPVSWLMPKAQAAEPAQGSDWLSQYQRAPEGSARAVGAPKPVSAGESTLRGLEDPVIGLAQLAAHNPIQEGEERAFNWLAQKAGFKPQPVVADTIDKWVAQREADYQARRKAYGDTGMDVPRIIGDVANPMNYVPMSALGRATTFLGNVGRAAAAGATSGALQPVTGGDFGFEKALQVALGGAAGAATAGFAELAGRGLSFLNPLIRYVRGISGPKAPENAAAKEVLRRIAQDQKAGGPTAEDMLDLVNASGGKPLTLADVGGENTLALAGKMARRPGEARQIISTALNDRDLGAGSRLADDVNKHIASGSSYDAASALSQARATAAAPKYEEAFAQPVTLKQVRPVQRFITDPIGQDALQKGMRIVELEDLAAGRMFNPEKYGVTRSEQTGRFIINPDIASGKKAPSMRMLDAVKRGYDEIVEGFRDPTSGRLNLNQYGRAVNDVRANYTGYLRQTFPKYADALNAWSGPSQSLDALRAGQNFLRQRPEEIARRLSTLTPGDREFYKLGAADTLRTAVAKKGMEGDEAKAILRNQYMRDQLRPLFDSDESYARFINSVAAEGRMFGTRYSVLRNSATAARLAEDQSPEAEAFAHAARGAVHATHGNMLGAGVNALKSILSIARAPNNELDAEIARILTAPLNRGSSGMELLRNFSRYMPATRNYLLQGSRMAAPALAPSAAVAVSPPVQRQ